MRTLIVGILFLLYFIFFLPVLAVLKIMERFDEERASHVTWVLVKAFLRLELFVSGTEIELRGAENIPEEPALFVGNHRSYFDVLSLYSLTTRPTGFVAKIEMRKFPILAQWMDSIGCVWMDRRNIKEGLRAILSAVEKVRSGMSMVIFPEGTRNRSDDKDVPAEFREGSLRIAEKAGCMIVPVAFSGTENCFEEHFPWVRPAKVRVTFLKPYYTQDIPEEYRKKPAAYTRMLIAETLKSD